MGTPRVRINIGFVVLIIAVVGCVVVTGHIAPASAAPMPADDVRTITIAKMHDAITPIDGDAGFGSRTVYYIMDTNGCVYRIHFRVPQHMQIPELAYCYDRVIWMNFDVNETYTVQLNDVGEIVDIIR
jgi:hypothetical protein